MVQMERQPAKPGDRKGEVFRTELTVSNPSTSVGVGGLMWIAEFISGSVSAHFAAFDGSGNVSALLSARDGAETRYEYGPFGETIRQTGTFATNNPFRFSAKFTDNESGMLYYGYRYYNPSTGRWPNRDPIHELGHQTLRAKRSSRIRPDDGNLYGFVYNAPLNFVDPDGLTGWAINNPVRWRNPNALDFQPPVTPPVFPDENFVGEEQHFIIGSGFTRASCCDENKTKRIFWYRKICIGGAIGFGAGAGAVITGFSGKNCRGSNYEGWFYELGGSIGPVSGGVDVGYTSGGDFSGVNEVGGGLGMSPPGVMFKSTWCYYTLFSEKHIPCGCGK